MRPSWKGMDPAVAGFFRVIVAVVVFWAILPVERLKNGWPKVFWPDRGLWIHIGQWVFWYGIWHGVIAQSIETGLSLWFRFYQQPRH